MAVEEISAPPENVSAIQELPEPFSFRRLYGHRLRRAGTAVGRWAPQISESIGKRRAVKRWQRIAALAITVAVLPLRLLLLVFDLVARWLTSLVDTVTGDRGYLTVASIVGAYLAIYGLADAAHQRGENRAALERSIFVTLASSTPASFVVAMKTFGEVQTMTASLEPPLLAPWTWGNTTRPNSVFMARWARARFSECKPLECSLDPKVRLDLSKAYFGSAALPFMNLSGANLYQADLSGADLTGAHLSGADLTSADLTGAHLTGAYLSGAHMSDADLSGADLTGTDLTRTDLSGVDLSGAHLSGATFSSETKFPPGFDPVKARMVRLNETDVGLIPPAVITSRRALPPN